MKLLQVPFNTSVFISLLCGLCLTRMQKLGMTKAACLPTAHLQQTHARELRQRAAPNQRRPHAHALVTVKVTVKTQRLQLLQA
jgi:hypothetical protein